MNYHDWKSEKNPVRRTAKRLLSGDPLTDGRPLSDLIELDERTRKELAFEATLTDQQIEMLQELGYLPSPKDNFVPGWVFLPGLVRHSQTPFPLS